MNRLWAYLYANYRSFAPLSCFDSPRPGKLRGWKRWRWLTAQRKAGRLIDPTVQIWCGTRIDSRLEIGDESHIDHGTILWLGDETNSDCSIKLGDRVYLGPYVFLGSCHSLRVGNDTMIGGHSYIITANHVTRRRDIPYARQGFEGADVTIGRNVWIGANVTILPGVNIGDHVVIGAGAVVTKSVPEGETWVGVPAHRIG